MARDQYLRCRVSEEEQVETETMILSLDARRARKLGEEITERLVAHAPFSNTGDFLRVVFGLEPLREAADAPVGRPRSKAPSMAALHARAARGDAGAREKLREMGVKPRKRRGASPP